MTLTEFLLARIAEDEADARAAYPLAMTGERWKHYPEDAYNEIQSVVLGTSRRMLAECEAKRRVVEDAEQDMQSAQALDYEFGDHSGHNYDVANSMQDVLKVLATVYADHPDYDEAWRP